MPRWVTPRSGSYRPTVTLESDAGPCTFTPVPVEVLYPQGGRATAFVIESHWDGQSAAPWSGDSSPAVPVATTFLRDGACIQSRTVRDGIPMGTHLTEQDLEEIRRLLIDLRVVATSLSHEVDTDLRTKGVQIERCVRIVSGKLNGTGRA
jgi:hypothetical protein